MPGSSPASEKGWLAGIAHLIKARNLRVSTKYLSSHRASPAQNIFILAPFLPDTPIFLDGIFIRRRDWEFVTM